MLEIPAPAEIAKAIYKPVSLALAEVQYRHYRTGMPIPEIELQLTNPRCSQPLPVLFWSPQSRSAHYLNLFDETIRIDEDYDTVYRLTGIFEEVIARGGIPLLADTVDLLLQLADRARVMVQEWDQKLLSDPVVNEAARRLQTVVTMGKMANPEY